MFLLSHTLAVLMSKTISGDEHYHLRLRRPMQPEGDRLPLLRHRDRGHPHRRRDLQAHLRLVQLPEDGAPTMAGEEALHGELEVKVDLHEVKRPTSRERAGPGVGSELPVELSRAELSLVGPDSERQLVLRSRTGSRCFPVRTHKALGSYQVFGNELALWE